MSKSSAKTILEICLGFVYAELATLAGDEVEDFDVALQELLEAAKDDEDSEVIEELQSALRDAVKHAIKMYAVRTATGAKETLEKRNENREGPSPEYVEEDV